MHTRSEHYRAIFGPWWATVNALWALLSSADTLVGKYGSEEFKKAWDASWVAPRWGWKVWLIGLAIITAIFAIEYSYRHIKKHETSSQARENDLQQRLSDEQAKNQRPDFAGELGEVFATVPRSWNNEGIEHRYEQDSLVAIQFAAWNKVNMAATSVKKCLLEITVDEVPYKGRGDFKVPVSTAILQCPDRNGGWRLSVGGGCPPLDYLRRDGATLLFYVEGLPFRKDLEAGI